MTNAQLTELLGQRDAEIKELKKQIQDLKKLLVEKAGKKEAKPPKEASNYSVSRHKQKKKNRKHKNSTG